VVAGAVADLLGVEGLVWEQGLGVVHPGVVGRVTGWVLVSRVVVSGPRLMVPRSRRQPGESKLVN